LSTPNALNAHDGTYSAQQLAATMKKSKTTDVRRHLARNHVEVFRHENRQYEHLLKMLNAAGMVADRLRQALDEVDRGSSVTSELRKVRERIERDLGRVAKSGVEGPSGGPTRYETNVAALRASNAKLLEAVQERARENQLHVCRALAMVQAVINTVGPAKSPASDSDEARGPDKVAA
jgi:hypothetical protein